MLSSHRYVFLIAVVACTVGAAGCRTTAKDVAEIDTILQTVSYDTTVPVTPKSVPASVSDPITSSVEAETGFPEFARSVGQSVSYGLRATAGFTLLVAFKIVESALGLDDDEEDECTPRGRADGNFRQWLDDRDEWLGDQ